MARELFLCIHCLKYKNLNNKYNYNLNLIALNIIYNLNMFRNNLIIKL
jgi:hypothetical protein